MQDKHNVPVDKLKDVPVPLLKAIRKAGEKHLAYYSKTMSVFKHPEKRVKAFDTKYYEEVLPIIKEILDNKTEIQ
jgi:mannitol/fructose-specific phosphotransferase system IIA component (Ntr-type)